MHAVARISSEDVKRYAREAGFDMAGITALRPSEHADLYRAWLAAGRHGSMAYLAREDAVERRLDPTSSWPALRSALVLALNYATGPEPEEAADASRGVIARYARGRDYHKVIRRRLLALLERIEAETGCELSAARAYVDTGPVLERELARRAGLGWFGRSTMLIHPRRGSYFFLATLLLELDFDAYDEPFTQDHCGTCNACVAACPTGALLGRDGSGAPVIDATRCISYLTIEQRGPIPRELRPLIGNRIFGCDICQEVCPFSIRFSAPSSEASFAARGPREPPVGVERLPSDGWHPGTEAPSLIDLMSMDEAGWDAFSRGSPLRRAGRAGFFRNVVVALGNWGSSEAVTALVTALSDPDPLVRGHAAWALGEVGSAEACTALESSLAVEHEPYVLEEVTSTLDRLGRR